MGSVGIRSMMLHAPCPHAPPCTQVPNPDPRSGLYIRDRHGRVVKANIPPDCIAFQVGCCGGSGTPQGMRYPLAPVCVRGVQYVLPPGAPNKRRRRGASHAPGLILRCAPCGAPLLEPFPSQVGEALQVHSGGLLRATPHYVRVAAGPAAAGVTRNTFAVFMQPDVDEPMEPPPGEGGGSCPVAVLCCWGSVVSPWRCLHRHLLAVAWLLGADAPRLPASERISINQHALSCPTHDGSNRGHSMPIDGALPRSHLC